MSRRPPRLADALAAFDAANSLDPTSELRDGTSTPRALWYGRRLSLWLARLAPEASEPLQLAVRSQHIRRWAVPRDSFPRNRQGYHAWRRRLQEFHAETAAGILHRIGYGNEVIRRVQDLLHKRHLKSDPEAQVLEDVVCIVFLESYLEEFRQQHDRDKLIGILQRTWAKMSDRGRATALALPLSASVRELLAAALA